MTAAQLSLSFCSGHGCSVSDPHQEETIQIESTTRMYPYKIVYRKALGILQLWGHRKSSNRCCSRRALLPHAIPSQLPSFTWLLPELKKLKFFPEGDTMLFLGLAWQRKARNPRCSPQKPIIHHLPGPLPFIAWQVFREEQCIFPWRRSALEFRFVWKPQATTEEQRKRRTIVNLLHVAPGLNFSKSGHWNDWLMGKGQGGCFYFHKV